MLKREGTHQPEMEFISIEELVPKNHLLRKIDRVIDFSFIYDKVEHLYCSDNGRPPIDPVRLFKMLLIGYLFGIRSERQLERDVEVNMAYRWFLGLGLRGRVPDHSTISLNRTQRFAGTDVYQEIFDEIVMRAIKRGLIDGKTLFTDSTHLKANANKRKIKREQVEQSTCNYLNELEEAVQKDRREHDKDELPPVDPKPPAKKEIKVSTTDPESGYLAREGKPEGFAYLDHRSVDGKHSLITDVHVTAGNVSDSVPYLERLDRQRDRFGFEVKEVGLDGGYNTMAICKGLHDRGVYGVMPYAKPSSPKGMIGKRQFVYDAHFDCYLCPRNQVLSYSTTSREGKREYKSDPKVCAQCPCLSQCTRSQTFTRIISRHVWEDHKEAVQEHRFEDRGKKLYKRRKETVERSFADAKQLHGHRYARLRGLAKVSEQCLMAATAQNLKKIAHLLVKSPSFCKKSIFLLRSSLRTLQIALETFHGPIPA